MIGFEHDSNASATYAIKELAAEDDARERTNIVVLLAFAADLPAIFAAAQTRGDFSTLHTSGLSRGPSSTQPSTLMSEAVGWT